MQTYDQDTFGEDVTVGALAAFQPGVGHLVRAVATVALLLMTASCAGTQPPPSTASSVAATVTPSPAPATPLPASPSPRPSPSPSPPAPPGGPAPPELTGAWHTALAATDQVELRFNENRYGRTRGPINEPGKIAVQGDEIAFYSSLLCKGTGTYRWSLHKTPRSPRSSPILRGGPRCWTDHVHPVTGSAGALFATRNERRLAGHAAWPWHAGIPRRSSRALCGARDRPCSTTS
jgi:hypothetical protein